MEKKDWSRHREKLGVVLAAACVGLFLWQGIRSQNAATKEVQRIQPLTSSAATLLSAEGETVAGTVSMTQAAWVTAAAGTTQAKKTTTATKTAVQTTEAPGVQVQFPLNLNQASVEELAVLPGIGTTLAERIVSYRDAIGGFQNREQLLDVTGIGEGRLGEIYDLLYLEQEWYPAKEPAAPETQPAALTESVPPVVQEIEKVTAAEENSQPPEPVSLNTADLETLMTLPHMTEELAKELLELRETLGGYSSVYEVLYAEKMTPAYFDEIRDFIQIPSEEMGKD